MRDDDVLYSGVGQNFSPSPSSTLMLLGQVFGGVRLWKAVCVGLLK